MQTYDCKCAITRKHCGNRYSILCVGVCGFSKRLKFHLQKNVHRTEKLRQRDFLKARVGTRIVDQRPKTGLV